MKTSEKAKRRERVAAYWGVALGQEAIVAYFRKLNLHAVADMACRGEAIKAALKEINGHGRER